MSGNGNSNGNGNGNGHPTHDVSLVTGFPAFTARRLVERLLARTADDRVLMLVRDKFTQRRRRLPGALAAVVARAAAPRRGRRRRHGSRPARPRLQGARRRGHRRSITPRPSIISARSASSSSASTSTARARCSSSPPTARTCAASCTGRRRRCRARARASSSRRSSTAGSASATSTRRPSSAPSAWCATPRAGCRSPSCVPASSSAIRRSGEIDKFDGPYYLLVLIVSSPIDVHLPLPGRGSAPLNLVPIDYVVEAAIGAVARSARRRRHVPPDRSGAVRRAHRLRAGGPARRQEGAARLDPDGAGARAPEGARARAAGARAARLPRGVQSPRALQLPPHADAALRRSVARALPAVRQLRRSAGALRARGAGATRSRRATTRRPTRSTWHEAAASALIALAALSRRRAPQTPQPPQAAPAGDDVDIAKAHFNTGQAYYEHGRFDDAAREFEEAYRLSGKAPLLYNVGKSYDGSNDFARALDAYQRFLAAAPPDNPDRDFVAKRVELLQTLVGKVTIDGAVAGSAVTLDGKTAGTDAARRAARRQPRPPPARRSRTKATPRFEAAVDVPVGGTADGRGASRPRRSRWSPSPRASKHAPVYKKWWLWTAVGGAVVVAGVITAVVVTSEPRPTGRPPSNYRR